jgi:ribosomal protein L44E
MNCKKCKTKLHLRGMGGMAVYRTVIDEATDKKKKVYDTYCPNCKEHSTIKR